MKKKLVMLSAFLSPYRSGAEAMVEEVSVRLPQDVFDITIITGRYDRRLPKHVTLGSGVKIVRVGLGFRLDKWVYPFFAASMAWRMKPDIVHAVLETFAGLALLLFPGSVTTVLTLQTTNRSFLKRWILKRPTSVTAISSALVDTARSMGRTDVHLIPNGVDLVGISRALSQYPKDSGSILFVGRLEPMKGVDTLLRAFADALKALHPSVHLTIVGHGSQRRALEALSEELDIHHRVRFLGHLESQDLYREFAKAEVFCGLSRSEALGNVFIEAGAAGCAIVASSVGGIPDIVEDTVTGLLVPPDDALAASQTLKRLMGDTELRARLSREARKQAQSFSWDDVARKYEALLRTL